MGSRQCVCATVGSQIRELEKAAADEAASLCATQLQQLCHELVCQPHSDSQDYSQLGTLPIRMVTRAEELPCSDRAELCLDWANAGECNRNPEYMHAKCQRACGLCSLQETEGASKKLVQQPLLQEVSIELERLRDEYERLRSAKGLAEQEVEQTKQDADHMQQLNNICEDALAWTRQELKSSQQGRHKLQMEANGLRHEEQLAQAILRTAQAEAEFLRQNQSHVEKLNAELRHSLQLLQNDIDQAQRERRQVENRLDEFKAALMGTQGGPLRYPQSNKCGTTTESNFTAWTWTESASQSLAVLFPFGCGAACVAFCGSPGKSGKRSREVAVQTSSLLGDHLHVLSQREDLCTTDSSGVSASSGTSDFLSELSNPCSVQPATHGGVLTSSDRKSVV